MPATEAGKNRSKGLGLRPVKLRKKGIYLGLGGLFPVFTLAEGKTFGLII